MTNTSHEEARAWGYCGASKCDSGNYTQFYADSEEGFLRFWKTTNCEPNPGKYQIDGRDVKYLYEVWAVFEESRDRYSCRETCDIIFNDAQNRWPLDSIGSLLSFCLTLGRAMLGLAAALCRGLRGRKP